MQVPVILPFLVAGLHDGFVAAGAGIVDENIGAAKSPRGFRHQMRGAFGGRHIAGDGDRVDLVRRRKVRPRLLQTRGVARGHHHVHALGGQPLGDGKPDADAGAGDHGDLVFESELHGGVLRLAI